MLPLRRRAWLRIFVVRCSLPCDPSIARSLNSAGARVRNCGTLFRATARHADAADDLAIDQNRDAALHEIDIWHGEVPQASTAPRDNILQGLGRPTKLNRGESL